MFALRFRIIAVVIIFSVLAYLDLRKNGKNATRWREYSFLIFCTVVAMAFAVANDQVTSRISWEYFYYGKDLGPRMGPVTPPDPARLSFEAARIAAAAAWWPGLFIGALMLIANNPSPRYPQLRYPQLARWLIVLLVITIITGAIGGWLGWLGHLNWQSKDFIDMASLNLWRPKYFMTTYGIHSGDYLGATIGLAVVCIGIRVARARR